MSYGHGSKLFHAAWVRPLSTHMLAVVGVRAARLAARSRYASLRQLSPPRIRQFGFSQGEHGL